MTKISATALLITTLLAVSTKAQIPTTSLNYITKYQTNCPRIGTVPWTGTCIGDYASVAVSHIEDIICIRQETAGRDAKIANALRSIRLSYMDVICNCDDEGCQNNPKNGCQGGNIVKALTWIQNKGIVGGNNQPFAGPDINYNTEYKTLKIRHCLNFYTPECTFMNSGSKYTTKCAADQPAEFDPSTHCPTNCNYKTTTGKPVEDYRDNKIVTYSPYTSSNLRTTDVDTQPVIGFMTIYEDIFMNDGEEVYVNRGGQSLGTFAVKVVGYDVKDSVPYWIVVLPFGTDVGKDGVVRVLRGVNHCNIEDRYVYIGLTRVVDNLDKVTP